MFLVLSTLVGGGKDMQNLMIIWNAKKKNDNISMVMWSRFCGCGGWGDGGWHMALADNCVHGGFCCNSAEHLDITTG